MIYLPENLFYNTSAPGILLFINKSKPKKQRDKLMLINASREAEKGDPKNFIPPKGVDRIATTFLAWKEEEKFSQIVERKDIEKNDFNVSPSRYIHTGEQDEYRAIDEIVGELASLEEEHSATNKLLHQILAEIA